MELVIRILSIGVVTSFVTGIFSLIVSIKNNRALKQIEKIKERFQMDQKRVDLLVNLLEEFHAIKFQFEENNNEIENSFDCLRNIFINSLDIYKIIKKLHKENMYLLDDPLYYQNDIDMIDQSISDYVNKHNNSGEKEQKEIEKDMDKISIMIYNLRKNYIDLIEENIQKIMKRE